MLFMANLRSISSKFPKSFSRSICDFSLPKNLRGKIEWVALPATPLDSNVIASYQCQQTKEKYLLEHVENQIAVLRQADGLQILAFPRDKLPPCWKIPGYKHGAILKPPSP